MVASLAECCAVLTLSLMHPQIRETTATIATGAGLARVIARTVAALITNIRPSAAGTSTGGMTEEGTTEAIDTIEMKTMLIDILSITGIDLILCCCMW